MLINFHECNIYCKNIKGIIHLGAHELEELQAYLANGVDPDKIIWVEAMEDKVNKYKSNNKIYNLCVSDVDNQEVEFKITNNGQSSSFLELGTHKESYPHITVVKTIKMKTTRMDTFIQENNIDINDYNFLNLDLQGVELKVLKGFGDLLTKIDYIYTEVNTREVYKNCALLPELEEYLLTYGFTREKIVMVGDDGWGDALFIKRR
jgi:FkbM family methyltransferase